MTHVPLSSCCLLLVAGVLSAQKTWVVDANGGAGYHFRDLPAAVAAAAHGDTISVRPGTYSTFDTAKGLRLLGEPGATIGVSGGLPMTGVSIHDVGIGRVFVLSGITFANESMVPAVLLKDCKAAVTLADIPLAAGVFAANCPRVSITRTALTGRPPILVIGSDVLLQDVQAVGDPGFSIPNVLTIPASVAVQIVSGRMVAVRSFLRGGGRWTLNNPPLPTAAAFDLIRSHVRVIGTECRAGTAVGTPVPQSAVIGSQSTFDKDATTILVPVAGAPAVNGVALTTSPTAALIVGPAKLGSSVSIDFVSSPGDLVWILLGVQSVRAPVPGFGDLYLDVTSALVVAQGSQSALPVFRTTIPLPNAQAVKGTAVAWQAIRFSPAIGASLSNPADSVLH